MRLMDCSLKAAIEDSRRCEIDLFLLFRASALKFVSRGAKRLGNVLVDCEALQILRVQHGQHMQGNVQRSFRIVDQVADNDIILAKHAIAGDEPQDYVVVRNLINNPKTPLDVTLHMLPMLNPQDLKRLTTNKNVPETLRTTAFKLQRTRAEQKK